MDCSDDSDFIEEQKPKRKRKLTSNFTTPSSESSKCISPDTKNKISKNRSEAKYRKFISGRFDKVESDIRETKETLKVVLVCLEELKELVLSMKGK